MGCCPPENYSRRISNLQLVKSILKCPNQHWLAVYQTQVCTFCYGQKNVLKYAKISCISCDFGVCEECYNRKLKEWNKFVNEKLSAQEAKNLKAFILANIQNFKIEFQGFEFQGSETINFIGDTNEVSGSRSRKSSLFLSEQSFINYDYSRIKNELLKMWGSNKEKVNADLPDMSQSIIVRVSYLSKIAQQILYDKEKKSVSKQKERKTSKIHKVFQRTP